MYNPILPHPFVTIAMNCSTATATATAAAAAAVVAACYADINFTTTSSADDRRLRRMISNRESARRSRLRKQRHLEYLRRRVGRLRLENSTVAERIAAIASRCILIRHENELFEAESAALCRRLSEIRQLLLLRRLDSLSSPPALSSTSSGGGDVTGHFGSSKGQILASMMA